MGKMWRQGMHADDSEYCLNGIIDGTDSWKIEIKRS